MSISVQRRSTGLLERIKRALTRSKKADVAVGFPAGKVKATEIQKALWNEFGTKGGGWGGPIPERPFMRNSIRNNKAKYQAALKSSGAKILVGNGDMEMALRRLGILAQGDIQSEITSLASPPNSPVTIKLKGSSNPLIDTGRMRQSVTWELRK